MQRSCALALLLLCSLRAATQIWCPPAATWTNTYSNGWTTDGYARFTYSGDTIIGSLNCQKILVHTEGTFLGSPFSVDPAPLFTTVNGDLVRILTSTGFDTLYHFGAAPGDHWLLTADDGSDSMVPVVIADTGSAVIDGMPLHYLATTSGDTIMERLGSLHHLMVPWVQFTLDAPDGSLRCYSDVDIDHMDPAWPYGCETWTSSIAASEPEVQITQAHGGLRIDGPGNVLGARLMVYDVTGRARTVATVRSLPQFIPLTCGSITVSCFLLNDASGAPLARGRSVITP